jgi:hypothetical protein
MKGLKKHVLGVVRQLAKLEERTGEHFKLPGGTTPLIDNELEKHEEDEDSYEKKQAAVREVIYRTVDKSTFLQNWSPAPSPLYIAFTIISTPQHLLHLNSAQYQSLLSALWTGATSARGNALCKYLSARSYPIF